MTLALTRKELLAVDNMAIIMKAKQDGLKLYASDLRINYAEMDHMLTELEDGWMDAAAEVMVKIMTAWASKIKTKEDMEKESGMAADFQRLLLAFIRSIWDYGQSTADVELNDAGMAEFDETKTNDDAFAWYQLYTKELAKQTDKAAFHYMQPTILEHLDQGTVGTELAAVLEDDFRKFGQVRTKIIARTESNKAFNWGRRYRFDQSKAIAGYRYSAILDERTTEICQALHGHSWSITDPALDQHTPPNHFMCRSVIVPISKYVTWEFDPPPAGWEDDLPKKERDVFSKFKASEFYPKAETVKEKAAPVMEKPKAQKKVVKPAPAAAPDNWRDAESLEHLVKAFYIEHGIGFDGIEKYKLETLKGVADKVEKVLVKYPEMNDGFVKNVTAEDDKGYNATAFVYRGEGKVYLVNEYWAGNNFEKKSVPQKIDARRSGWLVKGEGLTAFSTVTHEYGHVLNNYLNKNNWWKYVKTNETEVERYIKRKVLSKVGKKAGDVGPSLSKYATYNIREFFAEGFAEFMDSESPRGMAAAFGEVLTGIIEAMRKGDVKQ